MRTGTADGARPGAPGGFKDFVRGARVTDDGCGDLIGDMKADRRLPETFASRERLETHLALRGACSHALEQVPAVWRRYRGWLARNGVAAVLLLLAVIGPAGAQKIQDRHPAMTAPVPLTFEQRWEPVRQLLVRDALVALPPAPQPVQNAPTGAAAPVEPRPVRTVIVSSRKPDKETCRRHGLRTVYNGESWKCRR